MTPGSVEVEATRAEIRKWVRWMKEAGYVVVRNPGEIFFDGRGRGESVFLAMRELEGEQEAMEAAWMDIVEIAEDVYGELSS